MEGAERRRRLVEEEGGKRARRGPQGLRPRERW